MKCNKSVTILYILLRGELQRKRLFATMVTSGGWSSIQELHLVGDGTINEPLSLREAEHISSFVNQSENFRTLTLDSIEGEVDLEFFQFLLVESIPTMLGLKKFELNIHRFDGHILDMAGGTVY